MGDVIRVMNESLPDEGWFDAVMEHASEKTGN